MACHRLHFFCFGFFVLQIGSGPNPYPPPWERGRWPKASFASSTQPSFQNWVPLFCRSGRWLLCLSSMNTNSQQLGPPLDWAIQLLTASIPRGGWQFGNGDPQTQYGMRAIQISDWPRIGSDANRHGTRRRGAVAKEVSFRLFNLNSMPAIPIRQLGPDISPMGPDIQVKPIIAQLLLAPL